LVAFLDADDHYHDWAKASFKELRVPLLTCEAVIAETLYLLRSLPAACDRIYRWIENDVLVLTFSLAKEVASIHFLFQKYQDVPISLADACLVRMAEIHSRHLIFTLDSDFHIYRKNRNQVLTLLMPDRS